MKTNVTNANVTNVNVTNSTNINEAIFSSAFFSAVDNIIDKKNEANASVINREINRIYEQWMLTLCALNISFNNNLFKNIIDEKDFRLNHINIINKNPFSYLLYSKNMCNYSRYDVIDNKNGLIPFERYNYPSWSDRRNIRKYINANNITQRVNTFFMPNDGKFVPNKIERIINGKRIHYKEWHESRKNNDIIKFNAFFVDIDLVNDNGQKFDINDKNEFIILEDRKNKIVSTLKKMNIFNIITFTKNGIQAIISIKKNHLTLAKWQELEKLVLNITQVYLNKLPFTCKVDFNASNVARILRMPFSYHFKKDNGFTNGCPTGYQCNIAYIQAQNIINKQFKPFMKEVYSYIISLMKIKNVKINEKNFITYLKRYRLYPNRIHYCTYMKKIRFNKKLNFLKNRKFRKLHNLKVSNKLKSIYYLPTAKKNI